MKTKKYYKKKEIANIRNKSIKQDDGNKLALAITTN